MQRSKDYYVNIEEGKFIADKISQAKFVEFEGEDGLFWIGNSIDVLSEIKHFIRHIDNQPHSLAKERLIFNLCGTLFGSFDIRGYFDIIQTIVNDNDGYDVELKNGCFNVIFDSPGNAVRCGLAIASFFQDLDIKFGLGVSVNASFFTSNCKSYKDKIYSVSNPKFVENQLLVTHVVKNLLLGSDFDFNLFATFYNEQTKLNCEVYNLENNGYSQYYYHDIEKRDVFLERLLDLINQNIGDVFFGVEALSNIMSVSERHLQRKVKSLTGKAPGQLINSVRLQEAMKCIQKEGGNISEIAYKFGFSSPSYFSKCFKKEFGITPTAVLREK